LTKNIGYDVERFRSNVEYILVQLFHTIVHERVRNKAVTKKIAMPNSKALSGHRAGNIYICWISAAIRTVYDDNEKQIVIVLCADPCFKAIEPTPPKKVIGRQLLLH